MTDVNAIQGLLEKKGAALRELEREADALLTCETDELEEHMQARQRQMGQIDALDKKIAAVCAGPEQQALAAALRNRVDRDTLSGELAGIYDAAQQNFAVLNRILAIDQQATARLESERERLLLAIREHNQGIEAQAAKFHAGLTQPSGSDLLGGQKA